MSNVLINFKKIKNMTKHIAVIRMSAMGDVAISVPVLTAFAEQYPQIELTVVTRPLFAPIFSHIPNCKIFTPDLKGKHKGVVGLFRLYKDLKNQGINVVADIHNVLRTNILKLFFCLSGTPFEQIKKGRKEKKNLIRSKNKIFKQLKPSYERYADVFAALGMPISLEKKYFAPQPKLSNSVKNILSNGKRIGIAPFAAHLGKQYPFERMKKVIFELSQSYPNGKIYVFGGGNHEKEKINELIELKNVENIVGKYNFSEELQLISRLDVMVAMDSGNAHLSAMYGVPTITLWGVTHPYAGFYPYQQPVENALLADRKLYPLLPTSIYGNKYPKGYENAITTIQIEDILRKVKEILEE